MASVVFPAAASTPPISGLFKWKSDRAVREYEFVFVEQEFFSRVNRQESPALCGSVNTERMSDTDRKPENRPLIFGK